MKPKTNTLTWREIQVLDQLAKGSTCPEISSFFGISPANVHVRCHTIRQKTGIRQTRDPAECRRYLRSLPPHIVENALKGKPKPSAPRDLTLRQMEILRLIAHGHSYASIARTYEILPQTVQNHATTACQRAAIVHDGWNRTKRIREWLQQRDEASAMPLSPMADPMF